MKKRIDCRRILIERSFKGYVKATGILIEAMAEEKIRVDYELAIMKKKRDLLFYSCFGLMIVIALLLIQKMGII